MLAWLEPSWPKPRDLFVTLAACAAMAAVDLPLRGLEPGAVTMLLQIALGGGAYVATVAALDLAGLRSLLAPRLSWRGKLQYLAMTGNTGAGRSGVKR